MAEPDVGVFGQNGRFALRRRLGAGGFGVVYEALDRQYGAAVALKVLHKASPSAIYQFKQEFRVLADLFHPNLVRLYELDTHERRWFFTMELVAGSPFHAYLRGGATPAGGASGEATFSREAATFSQGPSAADTEATYSSAPGVTSVYKTESIVGLTFGASPPAAPSFDEQRLRGAFAQLAHAVGALHASGVLHRDLKPQNVQVTPEGRVVVLDFGLVKELSPGPSPGGEQGLAGTPRYMAPELWEGAPESEASDWYSFGVMLYEALSGQAPFHSLESLAERRAPPPPSALRGGVPADLEALCLELLRPSPGDRPGGDAVVRRLGGEGRAMKRAWGALPRRRARTLVGRERELFALRDAFRSSARGLVFAAVRGASGAGKTALCASFLDEAREAGALVLWGRCYERELIAYKAFDGIVDELARHLGALPEDRRSALLPHDLGDLARIFPVLLSVAQGAPGASPGPGAEPQEARRRAFRAFKELFARVAAEQPAVMLIDDLHWGDADSARLLAELLSPEGAPPLLLVACIRTEEEHGPFFTELARLADARGVHVDSRVIDVGPLAPEQAMEIVRAELGEGAGPIAEAIVREAGGNPFFLEEMAHHFRVAAEDTGPLSTGRGRVAALDEVLRARIARLDAPARRLLEIGAVAGRPIEQAIALASAELGPAALPALSLLRSARLVRARPVRDHTRLEPHHERVRDVVLAELGAGERAARHLRLARAYEAAGDADPEVLAAHYHGGGQLDAASRAAARAADRAAAALAFDRAAELYGRALEWMDGGAPGAPDRRRALSISRAHALANAGRGVEAAPLYLSAAPAGPASEALELRRWAAEQLLACGHIDAGIDVLRPVLREVGLGYPGSVPAAAARAAWLYVRLRVRGTSFEERGAAEIAPEVLAKIDVCGGAGKSLADVDPLRAACFQLEHLLLALQAGEPVRASAGLSAFGVMLAVQGTKDAIEKGSALVERGEAIARRLGDPYLAGATAVQRAFLHLVRGDWGAALAGFDEGLGTLQKRCRGVAWEKNLARMGAMIALDARGDLREVGLRSAAWLREALEVGDLFSRISAALNLAAARVAGGDVGGARQVVRDAIAPWSRGGFHVQHLYALRLEACGDLYEGDPNKAYSSVAGAWPEIERAQLLRVQLGRIDMRLLRARAAVASAAATPASRARLLAVAERDAAALLREVRRDARPAATLIQACAAHVRGDDRAALALLESAAAGYEAAGMPLLAACARRRRGELIGGDAGGTEMANADRVFESRGVQHPARWIRMYAPGFER